MDKRKREIKISKNPNEYVSQRVSHKRMLLIKSLVNTASKLKKLKEKLASMPIFVKKSFYSEFDINKLDEYINNPKLMKSFKKKHVRVHETK
jgi:hypothetical protein